MNLAADDPEASVRFAAFLQGLQELGWAIGRNMSIDTRWGAGDIERYRRYAAELVARAGVYSVPGECRCAREVDRRQA
jgi:hypothetical protein